jgi:hypothetical protein
LNKKDLKEMLLYKILLFNVRILDHQEVFKSFFYKLNLIKYNGRFNFINNYNFSYFFIK